MKLIFDIGMYDGADTAYYLSTGASVVAVEANPSLVADGRKRFASHLSSGRLRIVHGAISDQPGMVVLNLHGSDLGSSFVGDAGPGANIVEQVRVGVVTIESLCTEFGIPDYLKVDVEGSDRFAILPLTATDAPRFVSYELSSDGMELLSHLSSIGYTEFKIIDQWTFTELAYHDSFRNRATGWIRRATRRPQGKVVRRGGRLFIRGHSSGPLPDRTPGNWSSYAETRDRWLAFCERYPEDQRSWFDLHARKR